LIKEFLLGMAQQLAIPRTPAQVSVLRNNNAFWFTSEPFSGNFVDLAGVFVDPGAKLLQGIWRKPKGLTQPPLRGRRPPPKAHRTTAPRDNPRHTILFASDSPDPLFSTQTQVPTQVQNKLYYGA
jgi:hypothetical protein